MGERRIYKFGDQLTPGPAGEEQLIGHPLGSVARMFKGVGQDGILHLLGYPVRMRSAGSRQTIDNALSPIDLEVAADLVELLAAVAHDPAGLRDVPQFLTQLQQAKLATCYLLSLSGGHAVLRVT